jgi:hypothetical protein
MATKEEVREDVEPTRRDYAPEGTDERPSKRRATSGR